MTLWSLELCGVIFFFIRPFLFTNFYLNTDMYGTYVLQLCNTRRYAAIVVLSVRYTTIIMSSTFRTQKYKMHNF